MAGASRLCVAIPYRGAMVYQEVPGFFNLPPTSRYFVENFPGTKINGSFPIPYPSHADVCIYIYIYACIYIYICIYIYMCIVEFFGGGALGKESDC